MAKKRASRKDPSRVTKVKPGCWKRRIGKTRKTAKLVDKTWYIYAKAERDARRVALTLVDEWEAVCASEETYWPSLLIDVLTALCKGETITIGDNSDGLSGFMRDSMEHWSIARFNEARTIGERVGVSVVVDDPKAYEAAQAKLKRQAESLVDRAKELATSTGLPPATAANETIYQAINDFSEWIRDRYKDSETGESTDTGRTMSGAADRLKRATPDLPLDQLNYNRVESMGDYFRARPMVQKTGKPLAISSVKNQLKILKRFLKWLHRTDAYQWASPPFVEDACAVSVRKLLTSGEKQKLGDGVKVWTIPELETIYQYATDKERVYILAALNFGFAQSEIINLRKSNIESETLKMIRNKTLVAGRFDIWPETSKALAWYAENHPQPEDFPFVFGSRQGNKLTRHRIANGWDKLIKTRIAAEHPDFPRLSFKHLRKTSGELLKLASDGETMAVFHMRGQTVDTDEHADAYANRDWGKMNTALSTVRSQLLGMFDVAPDAFSARRTGGSPNIKRGQIEQIQSLYEGGAKPLHIASVLNVNRGTVYRWIKETQRWKTNEKQPSR